MWVVWAATHVHDPSILYAYAVYERWQLDLDKGNFKGTTAKCVKVLPEHQGLDFKHLLTMEMYAKPVDWNKTIDGERVRQAPQIDSGPKRFATDGSEL